MLQEVYTRAKRCRRAKKSQLVKRFCEDENRYRVSLQQRGLGGRIYIVKAVKNESKRKYAQANLHPNLWWNVREFLQEQKNESILDWKKSYRRFQKLKDKLLCNIKGNKALLKIFSE